MWNRSKRCPLAPKSSSLGLEFVDTGLETATNGPGSDKRGRSPRGAPVNCRPPRESSE
jgi:hypothetical protein